MRQNSANTSLKQFLKILASRQCIKVNLLESLLRILRSFGVSFLCSLDI